MGAEIGATTSMFGFDEAMARYLEATGRADVAELARAVEGDLRADDEVVGDPRRFFDEVIEIDLTELAPHINGPHTPDLARPVTAHGAEAKRERWPTEISYALVGSCTNSSYEDITRAASIARQAADRGLRCQTDLMITPGSEQVRATIERDGLLDDFQRIGATVLANACGPCIGQWARSDVDEGDWNTIVTSYNRNFPKRNDGFSTTLAFVTSPETVVALALAGTLDFDPIHGSLTNADGEEVHLDIPTGEELPAKGFTPGEMGYLAPPDDGSGIEVVVRPDSERLQLLEPFPAWDGNDYRELPVLVNA
jgi:aconitate hydratase